MSRLYAHRGAAAEEPENTLPSFEKALGYGVHGLEMDVHMTADGVVVVSHDHDGQRMCRESRAIKHTPFSELSQWDAGWGFVDGKGDRPFAERGYRIPRLEDVLSSFAGVHINIDLKQSLPSMVRAVMQIVANAGAEERVTLASFSQATLLHLRVAGYKGPTAMGMVEIASALVAPSSLLRRFPFRGQAAQIPTHHGPVNLASEERIARFHELGVRVDYWTINEPDEARALLARGADGIMTDDPARLMPIFFEREALN